MMLTSSRCCTAAGFLAILWFALAPFTRAQTNKPVPGELKVPPGRETQASPAPAAPGAEAKNDEKDKGKEEEKELPPSVTEHTLTVGGKAVRYRATAGYMVMRDWNEKKKGSESDGDKPREAAPSPAKEGDKSKDKDGKDKDEPKQKAKVFYVAYQRIMWAMILPSGLLPFPSMAGRVRRACGCTWERSDRAGWS